jgi:hypothetical protein
MVPTPEVNNKREEGLRALASVIADAYRRRAVGETLRVFSCRDPEEDVIDEREIRIFYDGGAYSETISIEHFIRPKRSQGKRQPDCTRGGQNVANKGNIRKGTATPAGQDQAGNQGAKK